MKHTLPGLFLLFAALGAGCDDDGESPAADAMPSADTGIDVTVDAEPAPEADMGLPFNYIPLNDEACMLADQTLGVQQAVDNAILDLIRGGTTSIDRGLEVCAPEPMNGCPACSLDDNPLNGLISAFNGPFLEYLSGFSAGQVDLGSLQDYFFHALRYPLRHLTTTVTACDALEPGACPAGTTHRVVLSQSKKQPCEAGFAECDHYSIEPESFDLNCIRPPIMLYGALEELADGGRRLVAALPDEAIEDDVTFGFIVPLIESLPPEPEMLTDDALQAWLDELGNLENRLDVRVHAPQVTIDFGDDLNTGCVRMDGWTEAAPFVELVEREDPAFASIFVDNLLPNYVDPENPERILGALSFELEPGTFTSGVPCNPDPCGADTVACVGDTLEYQIEQTRCALPREAGFADGDAIGAVCSSDGTLPWAVDCAALGASCEADACTVEWTTPMAGDLVISELFFAVSERPEGTRRRHHQWVELTNVTDTPLQVDGCQITTREIGLIGQLETIDAIGPLVVAPGQHFLLAQFLDPAANGGVAPDGVLGPNIKLVGENIGAFILSCGDIEVDRVTWDPVDWGAVRDVSMQLSPDHLDGAANDSAENWCEGTEPFGDLGGQGTPGGANTPCP